MARFDDPSSTWDAPEVVWARACPIQPEPAGAGLVTSLRGKLIHEGLLRPARAAPDPPLVGLLAPVPPDPVLEETTS
jgi:hypothetical protein